mgnify:CR=1 FL=1
MTDDELLRYSRHILLPEFDIEGQERLRQAHVLLIGLGGLGSAVAEALSAAPLPMRMVGIQDRYGQSAVCYGELLVHYGLTKENIAAAMPATSPSLSFLPARRTWPPG